MVQPNLRVRCYQLYLLKLRSRCCTDQLRDARINASRGNQNLLMLHNVQNATGEWHDFPFQMSLLPGRRGLKLHSTALGRFWNLNFIAEGIRYAALLPGRTTEPRPVDRIECRRW